MNRVLTGTAAVSIAIFAKSTVIGTEAYRRARQEGKNETESWARGEEAFFQSVKTDVVRASDAIIDVIVKKGSVIIYNYFQAPKRSIVH